MSDHDVAPEDQSAPDFSDPIWSRVGVWVSDDETKPARAVCVRDLLQASE